MIGERQRQEIMSWTDNLLADVKRLRAAVDGPGTETLFEAFNDVEHDFEKLSIAIDSVPGER